MQQITKWEMEKIEKKKMKIRSHRYISFKKIVFDNKII